MLGFFPGVSCIYIILVNKPANQRKTPQRHSNSLSSTHTFDKLLKSVHTRSCYEFTPCAGQKALPLTPALCPQDTSLPWSHMFPQSADGTWKAVRGPSNVWGGDHVWMERLRWCWRSRSVFSAEGAGFRTGPWRLRGLHGGGWKLWLEQITLSYTRSCSPASQAAGLQQGLETWARRTCVFPGCC